MSIKILMERPPNFEAIAAVFPVILTQKGVLYCYGDNIFNPDSVEISDPLFLHEERHNYQQNNDPENWWGRYLVDSAFRFEQELEAHQVEYRAFYEHCGIRNQRRAYLTLCAKRLSGALYGHCVSREKAIKLIKDK